VDISEKSKLDFLISEECIHVDPAVESACEILGLDALYIANEGCFIAFTPQQFAAEALGIMRQFPECKYASVIGQTSASGSGKVRMKNSFGVQRYLHQLTGSQLPRIC
jgi:hydrogenase expression/formation protein HypE